ncbi:hypothetical protein Pan153_00780 [Gimesia panareensis]|uniref:Uncharacterized protein n=1 Tax=Gimesia panareensis TaxID=2527978 RepID=A0A517PZH9_9PLAN|nr:hypothetical protein Enr10x_00770 [Gimesia panareensis]QDV15464.1 hypothetical protein Pan153_00780 [Gimesia panareensis]
MGSTYHYKCNDCGYTVEVSGGPDVGFVVKTQTGVCSICNELVDYVTEVWCPDGKIEKTVVIGACPKCKTQIEQVWNHGDPCPKCGGKFGERELGMQWI